MDRQRGRLPEVGPVVEGRVVDCGGGGSHQYSFAEWMDLHGCFHLDTGYGEPFTLFSRCFFNGTGAERLDSVDDKCSWVVLPTRCLVVQ